MNNIKLYGTTEVCILCSEPLNCCPCNISIHEYDKLKSQLASSQERIEKLESALNKLAMMTYGEYAYTSEFQDRLRSIVEKALGPSHDSV